MHNSPKLGGIWGLILAALYFITRRNDVKKAEKKDAKNQSKPKA